MAHPKTIIDHDKYRYISEYIEDSLGQAPKSAITADATVSDTSGVPARPCTTDIAVYTFLRGPPHADRMESRLVPQQAVPLAELPTPEIAKEDMRTNNVAFPLLVLFYMYLTSDSKGGAIQHGKLLKTRAALLETARHSGGWPARV